MSAENTRPKKKARVKEYDVEKILDQEIRGGRLMFLVKWREWSNEHNTWEPVQHLENCQLMLANFLRSEYERNSTAMLDLRFQLAPPETLTREALEQLMKEPDALINPPSESEIHHAMLTLIAIPVDQRDQELVRKTSRAIRLQELQNTRMRQLAALKEWEAEMKYSTTETANIIVENNIDLEFPPKQFVYVNNYMPGESVVIPEDPPIGCKCSRCDARSACTCFQQGGGYCYNTKGQIRVQQGSPIYECNKKCKCDINCPNRVVQRGRIYPLCIFRTDNDRGWGVKTLQRIPFGKFVCRYVGEVITSEEAEKRGKEYDALGRTYLFDLDYNSSDDPYTVDATKLGNLSHFINHSCEPNLGVWAVWADCLDPNLPMLALFALRDIEKGEELSFNYMARNSESKENDEKLASPGKNRPRLDLQGSPQSTLAPRTICKCNADACRKYLF